MLVVAMIISFWGKQNGITVDFPSRTFRYPFGEFIIAMSSIYIILCVSYYVCKYTKLIKRVLVFCGINSMGIMVFHFAFFKIFLIFLYKMNCISLESIQNVVPDTSTGLSYWILITLWAIICSMLLWNILMRIPITCFLLGQDKKEIKIFAKKYHCLLIKIF